AAAAAAQLGKVIALGGPSYNGYMPAMDIPPQARSGVRAVAAGGYFSMAIVGKRRLVVEWPPLNYSWWGPAPDPSTYTSPPKGLSGVQAIAAGDAHSLALLKSGKVVMWMRQLLGGGKDVVPPAVAAAKVKAIAAGRAGFSMALTRNGSVLEWPARDYAANFTRPPPSEVLSGGVRAVAAGWDHCLALLENGTVVAWGGAKGSGASVRALNVPPAALSNVVAIAAGYQHSMALLANGTVVAWGAPLFTAGRATCAALSCQHPAPPPAGPNSVPAIALSNVTAISAGKDYAMVLLRGGQVFVWGKSSSNLYIDTIPPEASSKVFAISAGPMHWLAVRPV
ncbi:Protein pim1, partial [Tetrabaena socialis]